MGLVPALAAAEPLDLDDPTPRMIQVEFEISQNPATVGQTWSAPFMATYSASGNTGTVVMSSTEHESAIATQQLDYFSLLGGTLVPGTATPFRIDIDLTTGHATLQQTQHTIALAITPAQNGVVTRNFSSTTVAGFAFHPSLPNFPFFCAACTPLPGAPYDPLTGRLLMIGSDRLVAPDVTVNGFARAGDLRLSEGPAGVPAIPGYGLLALAALLTGIGVASSGISRRTQARISSAM